MNRLGMLASFVGIVHKLQTKSFAHNRLHISVVQELENCGLKYCDMCFAMNFDRWLQKAETFLLQFGLGRQALDLPTQVLQTLSIQSTFGELG